MLHRHPSPHKLLAKRITQTASAVWTLAPYVVTEVVAGRVRPVVVQVVRVARVTVPVHVLAPAPAPVVLGVLRRVLAAVVLLAPPVVLVVAAVVVLAVVLARVRAVPAVPVQLNKRRFDVNFIKKSRRQNRSAGCISVKI